MDIAFNLIFVVNVVIEYFLNKNLSYTRILYFHLYFYYQNSFKFISRRCAFVFLDIDDCHPNPCQNGGTCTDKPNGYYCKCAAGYTGRNCSEGNNLECSTRQHLNASENL